MSVGYEVERRFLVDHIPAGVAPFGLIRQGYFLTFASFEVRVRCHVDQPRRADMIGLKVVLGPGRRLEIELPVPKVVAKLLFRLAPWTVTKFRSLLTVDGQLWEIDEYRRELKPLVTAEAELSSELSLNIPAWAGTEVTDNRAWSNSSLARHGTPGSVR